MPPYTVVPGGTTPIGGAIKPSIDGLKGKLAYGHGQRSILLFFFFFFLYKEISREMKENDSSSLRIIIVVENFVLVGQGRFLIDYDSIGDDEMEIIII